MEYIKLDQRTLKEKAAVRRHSLHQMRGGTCLRVSEEQTYSLAHVEAEAYVRQSDTNYSVQPRSTRD